MFRYFARPVFGMGKGWVRPGYEGPGSRHGIVVRRGDYRNALAPQVVAEALWVPGVPLAWQLPPPPVVGMGKGLVPGRRLLAPPLLVNCFRPDTTTDAL
jgi:hypothetical protein